MKLRLYIGVLSLLAVLCGCHSVEYVGQSFASLSEEQAIGYYTDATKLPRDQVRKIGHGTLQLPAKYDRWDIREMVTASAREHGADTVCIVNIKRVPVGVYPQERGDFANPNPQSSNPAKITTTGGRIEVNAFGQEEPLLTSETQVRYENRVEIAYYKNRVEFERLMAERRRQLENYAPTPEKKRPASATGRAQK